MFSFTTKGTQSYYYFFKYFTIIIILVSILIHFRPESMHQLDKKHQIYSVVQKTPCILDKRNQLKMRILALKSYSVHAGS